MKLSRKWLNEFVELSLEEKNDHDFAEAMTMTGSKVEGTSYMGEGISRVVVGKIVEMVRHHDSDHMWTCQVDVGGEYLKGCEVFDVYKGANIPEGKKSVAFSLTLRSDDQTLTDAHADEAVQAILAALREKFGAVIR